jgi:hypothetical protein
MRTGQGGTGVKGGGEKRGRDRGDRKGRAKRKATGNTALRRRGRGLSQNHSLI